MSDSIYELAVEALPRDRPVLRTPPCPVCAAETAQPTMRLGGMPEEIVVCGECGLGRLHPMPDRERIRGFYPDHYYGSGGNKFSRFVEAGVRLVGGRHARFLSKGLPPGARILDVGCGRGVILGALADRGFAAHGMDISHAAVQGADPRAHVRIAWSLAEAGYPEGYFDQIVIWHVLEHVDDPHGTIAESWRILKPGGRLIVALPNFSSLQARWAGPAWFHLDPPRHLYHFPLRALERLITSCGFHCTSAHHFSLRQNPVGWVQSALNMIPALPRNGLYQLLQPASGVAADYPDWVRLVLRLAYVLGMPLGLGLSVVGAAARSGATVHVVALRVDR